MNAYARPLLAPVDLLEAVSKFLGAIAERWQRSAEIRKTIKELDALTDSELDDIGISRGSIPEIARRSVGI